MPTVNVERLSFLKNPRRGGQNLSQRYRRLERSIRGKTVYGREIQDLERTGKDSDVSPGSGTLVFSSTAAPTRRTFKGFVIPERPKPPADDECCMSGCAVCVYDLYDEARNDYIHALDKIRIGLKEMDIPQNEWPPDICLERETGSLAPSKPNVALSAFEQLEMALKAKKESNSSAANTMATTAPVALNTGRPITKRPPRKKPGWEDVYEGFRWMLFSNR